MRTFIRSSIALALALTGVALPALAEVANRSESGTGSKTFATQAHGQRFWGFNQISFTFENGDHKVKQISSLLGASSTTVGFADNDGNDRFVYRARNVVLPSGSTYYETHFTCRAANQPCEVKIARAGTNQEFVLTGFSFKRTQDDSNIRILAIEPKAIDGLAYVDFRDNGSFAYSGSLQYSYVFKDHVVDGRAVKLTGTRQRGEPELLLGGGCRGGTSILQAFRFEFKNGDHKLKEFAIRLDHDGARVRYNDANYDDTYQATVWSLALL